MKQETKMDDKDHEFDILGYVQDNIAGLCLFIFAFVIIYIVDRFGHYNAQSFSSLPMIPTVPGIAVVPPILKKLKSKKKPNGKF